MSTAEEMKLSATAERFCRRFSLAEIQLATADFSEAHLIGIGGFGKVYKAQIGDEQETVAIKRLAPNSNQGEREFWTEVETLSKLRHLNLVSLIGYCNENGEMILVYEYIPLGTLADNLYSLSRNNDSEDWSVLTWKQRLNICTGAARGLDYLHTGTSIIHRDVKSTNILLDQNFTAKVSDFGLAKHLGTINPRSHVSTIVKGSFGYLDPSYFTTCRLTKHSDTYAFGVVLLEVLCGRPAVDPRLGEDEMSLVMWAQDKISKGKVDQIIASNLRNEIAADCLKTFVGIAKKCLNHDPKKRPTMSQVVAKLEFAVEQLDRKAHTLNASLFLPFWSRVKPSGSRATESSDVPATHEEALKHEHTAVDEVDEVDESEDKLAVNVVSEVAPAIALNELKEMTDNFSSECLIGSSGRVYHGFLKSGQAAAVKRIAYRYLRDNEFLEQVSKASSLNHENVVHLLGYCLDDGQQFLAYELAQNGSLHDILHGELGWYGATKPVPFLSWAQRVRIAMGVAEGLNYIHDQGQIHRNIKSSNILLFDDYQVAKLADFGLSPQNSYDKAVRGDYHPSVIDQPRGYLAPEVHGRYTQHRILRWMSDVYSFGVVLLELLTGGKLVDYKRPTYQRHIVTWARPWLSEDKVNKVVDARLNGDYPPKAVAKMAAIAALCLQETADDRPNMGIIIKALRPLLKATAPSKQN